MSYTITRPLMTRDELARYYVGAAGRDYSKSDDGYSDMGVAEGEGWRAVAGWGRDGWDLGDWPYVMVYIRTRGAKYEVRSICEGDSSFYAFDSLADRDAALDYLFLWYAAGKRWAPLGYGDREALDAGEVTVDAKFRGPYRDEEAA